MKSMSHIGEICTFEHKLGLILGHPIHLRAPEVADINQDSLKKAYFRRAHECHPDKAASLGVSPEVLTVKFRSLQEAYDTIRAAFESGEFERLVSERRSPFTVPAARSFTQRPMQARPTPPNTRPAGEKPRPKPSSGIFHAGSVPEQKLRFAQYLYYTKRIDWDALIGSMSWQYSKRPKLGTLGIELGYLSHAQVCAILRSRIGDEFFGSAAVRLGYLDPGKLVILVGKQRLINIPIGRFFVEQGYLNEAELSECLDAFRLHNFRVRSCSRIPV
jgi:hypothetical protein